MELKETYLKGCYIISPRVFYDDRGYFLETFNKNVFFEKTGIIANFVQDNISKSSRGVLRGLHFQKGNHAQAKLVQVIKGSVLDVCVDIRKQSSTFGQYISAVLTGENKKQIYMPRGFAHGFVVLEDETIFSYKCDNFYNQSSESGIIYNDETLNIDWQLAKDEFVISKKDEVLLTFKDLFNE
ncbi:dTDP-4-dehydrorhamnose 3,5-epimerase [Algibacter sp. AS12]|uniref:dTDP-4-dehydrorhamnose 3,5-epimerase n=1 Tax=Algibacter sp. AS12 TaxID=3135773 RepID=UPI00398AD05C